MFKVVWKPWKNLKWWKICFWKQIFLLRHAHGPCSALRLFYNLGKIDFFTIFHSELGLSVNMKVVNMDVSFLMALVWLHYHFIIWVMVKILHVGHYAFLWNFSITMLKWTQEVWLDPKPRNLINMSLISMCWSNWPIIWWR